MLAPTQMLHAEAQNPPLFDTKSFIIILILSITVLLGWWLQKRQQKLLDELNRKNIQLSNAQKVSKLGFWQIEHQSGTLEWGPQVYDIFEVSPGDISLTYGCFLDFIHPEDRQKVDEAFQSSLREGSSYDMVHRIITKSGKTKYIHEHCEHLKNKANGAVTKSMGTVYDITMFMQTQSRLEYTNTLFKASVNATSDLIFFKDENLFYIDCNKAFCEFAGKDKEFIIGKSDFELFEPQLAGLFKKMDKKALQVKNSRTNIEWITYPSGMGVCVETQRAPFVYDGDKRGVIGISRDISKMIQYQEELKSSQQRLKTFIEKNKAVILVIDPEDGRIIQSNEKAREFYMYTQIELENMLIQDINTLGKKEIREEMDRAVLEKRNFFSFKHRLANGVKKDVNVYSSPISFEGKKYLFYIVFDVTEKLKNEEKLQLFAEVFTNADQGIIVTNKDNQIIDVNRAFCSITGFDKEDALGQTPAMLKSGRHDKEFYKAMWKELLSTEHWSGEVWNRRKNGVVYPQYLKISLIKDTQNQVKYFIGLLSDESEQKIQQQKLKNIAYNDILTGLPNRVLFLDRLNQAILVTQRELRTLAVVFIDIDGFKEVNDTYGHDVGDDLLIKLAHKMKDVLRDEDSIARIGGDEFVAVLQGAEQASEYTKIIKRLLKVIEGVKKVKKCEVKITASIGVSLYPQRQNVSADGLLRQADQAMYKAKLAGKNRYYTFDEEEDETVKRHHKDLDEMLEGLQRGEFELYYQPKVDMRAGKVVGVEALIRWKHPKQGLLSPDSFLPLMEDHPFSINFGEWVLERAILQLGEWEALGLHMSMSINISAYHLKDKNFLTGFEKLLEKHSDIDPSWLELEILETSALDNLSYVSKILKECRKIGVRIALDDFGTGYSSLTYLRRLAANTLKIDKSFVMGMLESEEDLSILEGVVGLSRAFGTDLVAEGVETKEHGASLIQLGCDIAQGYYIAKPMPASNIPTWIKSWKPDKSWALQKRLHKEDMVLMSAITKHREWLRDLKNILEYDDYISINLNAQECKFGVWLKNSGELLYEDKPAFVAIKALHVEIHQLGKKLMKLRADGKIEEARRVFTDIQQKSDQMFENIEYMM